MRPDATARRADIALIELGGNCVVASSGAGGGTPFTTGFAVKDAKVIVQ